MQDHNDDADGNNDNNAADGEVTPRFVLSRSKVMEQYNIVKSHSDIISYSSKTNQDVTKILEEYSDSFFSVHLENELKHLSDMSRVIFLAQGWDTDLIDKLANKGIRYFIVDNTLDLNLFLNYVRSSDKRLNLFLRMKLKENSIRTEKYFVFGMYSDVINKKIQEIHNDQELRVKIPLLGIHFHRKTQNMSEWNLHYEIESILDFETLQAIDMLNIGGGLPSEYANTNVDVIGSIWEKIKDLKSWLNENHIKLIIEPGRFIAASAVKLKTKIIAIYDNNIIVDASVYNTDMDAIVVPVKLLVEGELTKEQANMEHLKPFVIKGVTPCSMDLFRYRVYLKSPRLGDTLTFLNAGAYNFSSDFCDLEKLPTEIIG